MSDYDPDDVDSDEDTDALERYYDDDEREALPAAVQMAYEIWLRDPAAEKTRLRVHEESVRLLLAYMDWNVRQYSADSTQQESDE